MSLTHKSIPPTRLTPSPIFQIHNSYLLGSATWTSNTRLLMTSLPFLILGHLSHHQHTPSQLLFILKTQLRCLYVQKVLSVAQSQLDWLLLQQHFSDLTQQLLLNPALPPLHQR